MFSSLKASKSSCYVVWQMINSVTSDFARLLFKYDGLQSRHGKSTKVTSRKIQCQYFNIVHSEIGRQDSVVVQHEKQSFLTSHAPT